MWIQAQTPKYTLPPEIPIPFEQVFKWRCKKKKTYPGAMSTPCNLDPSDPPKITGTTPKVHTERNFSVPATCSLTQITTTALSLFKEHLKESHYLHKQYHLERNAEKSLSCSMGSQWVAPGLKDPLLSSENSRALGRRWVFRGPPFHKKCLYKQAKPVICCR